jgi:hypothetical protein
MIKPIINHAHPYNPYSQLIPHKLPEYHFSNSFTFQVENFNGQGKLVLLVAAVKASLFPQKLT